MSRASEKPSNPELGAPAPVLVCAWCGVDLEREAAAMRRRPRGLSHGICRACYHRVSVVGPRRAANGSDPEG